jgi:hypothetical protein
MECTKEVLISLQASSSMLGSTQHDEMDDVPFRTAGVVDPSLGGAWKKGYANTQPLEALLSVP